MAKQVEAIALRVAALCLLLNTTIALLLIILFICMRFADNHYFNLLFNWRICVNCCQPFQHSRECSLLSVMHSD